MREAFQVFSAAALSIQLDTALRFPSGYHGDPRDLYQSVRDHLEIVRVQLPDFEQVAAKSDVGEYLLGRLRMQYPDYDELIRFAKVGNGLVLAGFGSASPALRQLLQVMRQELLGIATKYDVPAGEMAEWFRACEREADRLRVGEQWAAIARRIATAVSERSTGLKVGQIRIDRVDYLEGRDMEIKNIEGNVGAIIEKSTGNVITTFNEGLVAKDLKDVAEAFALVRAEILGLGTVPEKVRKRANAAIKEAEDELADDDRDPDVIQDAITRAKETLEKAGESWDRGKGWCGRMLAMGKSVVAVLPQAKAWVEELFR